MKTLNELNGLVLSENTIEAYYTQQAQAKPIKQAEKQQARSYTSKRKGYIKALPRAVTTPKAIDSRWAQMAIGTDKSFIKNTNQTDARPKASLGNRRDMIQAMSRDGIEGEILAAKNHCLAKVKQAQWQLAGIKGGKPPIGQRRINHRIRRNYAHAIKQENWAYVAQLKAEYPELG